MSGCTHTGYPCKACGFGTQPKPVNYPTSLAEMSNAVFFGERTAGWLCEESSGNLTQATSRTDCLTCGTPRSFHHEDIWCRGGKYEGQTFRAVPTTAELACAVPVRSPAEILASAIQRAQAMLPHGIELTGQRNIGFRSHDLAATCPHCGGSEVTSSFSDDALDAHNYECATTLQDAILDTILIGVRNVMRPCIEATCCDPLDRLVDGLTVRQCLDQYTNRQRNEGRPRPLCYGMASAYEDPLTQAQLAAARSAWSSELKRKQAEARDKERMEVTVDDDRWEP